MIFSLPSVNNLGFFDEIVLIKNRFWILPVGTGLFDIANGNWTFDIANEDWVLILLVGIGLFDE